jgi:hypothetical protein
MQRRNKMEREKLIKKMMEIAGLPPQRVSLCTLAKYMYSGRYPQLCTMCPAEINVIAGWAEGANDSRTTIITIQEGK